MAVNDNKTLYSSHNNYEKLTLIVGTDFSLVTRAEPSPSYQDLEAENIRWFQYHEQI